jgi:hypothetical protein
MIQITVGGRQLRPPPLSESRDRGARSPESDVSAQSSTSRADFVASRLVNLLFCIRRSDGNLWLAYLCASNLMQTPPPHFPVGSLTLSIFIVFYLADLKTFSFLAFFEAFDVPW